MTVILNPILVKQQDLAGKDMLNLNYLHNLKDGLFRSAEILDPEDLKELQVLRYLAGALEDIEFAMQAAWGFEQTNLKHSWWCQLPGCECIPDYDDVGFPLHSSPECKIHA